MRVRIDGSNPIGAIIIAVIMVAVVCGLFYGVLNFIVEKVILPLMKVPAEKREGHILNKIVMWLSLLVALFGLVSVILPVCGVETGPLNLLNILDI